jgi:diphosphate-dependent phosphofructokinase
MFFKGFFMSEAMSPLQKERLNYQPEIPPILKNPLFIDPILIPSQLKNLDLQESFPNTYQLPMFTFVEGKEKHSSSPLKVGVVFSGGQAPGGHNVLSGLFDTLMKIHPKSSLVGFLGGPSGILLNQTKEITKELLSSFRNQGGFDLLGSGRTKIEKEEDLQAAQTTMSHLKLDGLVIIGGDDSNTNAALLSEFFLQKGCPTKVVGVPKTIDGDLQNEHVEISFGFDTACKVYSELIGNIARDALSAKKYYHFIKLMGRSASHIALECALQTHPNLTLIGEEILEKKQTLQEIVDEMVHLIVKRSQMKKNYGVILIPEGVIEFIPEMQILIQELNQILALKSSASIAEITTLLKKESSALFSSLPKEIQEELLLGRDPHGNILLSQIETEKLFLQMCDEKLKTRKDFSGKFSPLPHFFGYEGRAALPSNFDAQYCTCLGALAAVLIHLGQTGSMCGFSHLKETVDRWIPKSIPLISLLHLEMRSGKKKPVIKKALVDLTKEPFVAFQEAQEKWKFQDVYLSPGPIQFFGEKRITNSLTYSLYMR